MSFRGIRHGPPNICLKFEGERQASSPTLCASVRAVPWADEAEQQLSRLVFLPEIYLQTFAFSEDGLTEAPITEPQLYVSSLKGQDKQAAPVSVPLCEQCHAQMRLSNIFPG